MQDGPATLQCFVQSTGSKVQQILPSMIAPPSCPNSQLALAVRGGLHGNVDCGLQGRHRKILMLRILNRCTCLRSYHPVVLSYYRVNMHRLVLEFPVCMNSQPETPSLMIPLANCGLWSVFFRPPGLPMWGPASYPGLGNPPSRECRLLFCHGRHSKEGALP